LVSLERTLPAKDWQKTVTGINKRENDNPALIFNHVQKSKRTLKPILTSGIILGLDLPLSTIKTEFLFKILS
jgi:hypothetical protein